MARDPARIGVENLILIQRIGNTLKRASDAEIRALFDDLVGLLARIDPASAARQATKLRRVEEFLSEAGILTADTFDDWQRMMRGDLAAVGSQQADTAREMLAATLGDNAIRVTTSGLGVNYFKQVLDSQPFRGETLAGWASRQESATIRRLGQQMRIGVLNNETIGDLTRRVRGRSIGGGRYSGGILSTTTNEAEAIVRTAVNEIANTAHFATYSQNRDVTKMYEYVATLDSRTTPICASLDGQTFGYDSPDARRPPQHFNCRSTIIPVVDWEGLGIEPPREGTRAAPGTSSTVPASTTYADWLERQSAAVQAEVLGAGRARLFREGRVSLRDLVRSDGTTIPLEEIRGG